MSVLSYRLPIILTGLYLYEDQREKLKRQALDSHSSMSKIVREAIDAYFEKDKPSKK